MERVKAHTDNKTLASRASTNNSGKKTKRPRRHSPAAPELPEKTKKLTLKAFELAYAAHHGKRS